MSDEFEDEYDEEDGDEEEAPESITSEQAVLFESTRPLLHAMAKEFEKLSSKKPETTLSKTKVTFVNRLLTDLKGLLANEPTIKYLDLLTDEELPQYSDVMLILSQYQAAMVGFRSRYFNRQTESWNLQDDPDEENDEESGDQEDHEEDIA
jgi:hypothetical protein